LIKSPGQGIAPGEKRFFNLLNFFPYLIMNTIIFIVNILSIGLGLAQVIIAFAPVIKKHRHQKLIKGGRKTAIKQR
jgi:hypothetical protein